MTQPQAPPAAIAAAPRAARRALLAIGLVAAGALAWLWPQLRGESAPPAAPPTAPRASGEHGGQPAQVAPGDRVRDPIDAAVAGGERVPGGSDAMPDRTAAQDQLFAQGLRGLVLDPTSQPVPGATVYLVESASNDPLLLPLMHQQQHFLAPVAGATTAADGSFSLGLEVVQDKTYEVYVASARFATARLTGLRLLPGEWHDLGAVTMVPGATLRGRVTVAGRPDIPVPQALVTVESGSAFADAALRALPGQAGILAAQVDAAGNYELPHAPQSGRVLVSAVAPGFARVVRRDIELNARGPIEVDFQLPPGESLAGDVVDERAAPVAGARIEAWAKRPGEAPLIAFSDDAGRFVLHGLVQGEHRVRVLAAGYQNWQREPVAPGAPLHVVLAPRAHVLVRVTTPGGTVLRRYRLALRRWFPPPPGPNGEPGSPWQAQIGAVAEVPELHVRLGGDEDQVALDGVPPGTFVCQVEADGYAKTQSAPFEIAADAGAAAVPTIEIAVTAGATLRGQIVDARGAPLAGAVVTTQVDGATTDNPLFRLLQGVVPNQITSATATTAADGSFAFAQLALADYQLVIEHADACRTVVPGIELRAATERRLAPIALPDGALVTGIATAGGRIAGQMKVVLTTPATARGAHPLRLETVTDAGGRFRMPRRVPPGDYELRAAVVGDPDPDAQVFQQLLQLQRTAFACPVLPGQDVVTRDIDVPPDN